MGSISIPLKNPTLLPLYTAEMIHVPAWRHLPPRPPCRRSNPQASGDERNEGFLTKTVQPNQKTKNEWNMDEFRVLIWIGIDELFNQPKNVM